jgi:hypothetical protein
MDVLMPDGTIISGVPEGITQKDLLARYGRYQANVEAKTEAVAKNSPFDVMSGVPIGPEAGIASLPQAQTPQTTGDQIKAFEPTFFDEMLNIGKRGLLQQQSTKNALMLQAGQIDSSTYAERTRELERKMGAAAPSGSVAEGLERLQQANETGSYSAVGKELLKGKNLPALGALIAESAVATSENIPAIMLSTMAAGPAGGAAAAGVTSFAAEFGSALGETLEKRKIDPSDTLAVRRAMEDPEFMSEARERGIKRGIPIAAFDALSAGIAGRFVSSFIKALERGAVTGVKTEALKAGAKEAGVQVGAGMAGEKIGQMAVGENKPLDVLIEGLAEMPGGIAEVIGNVRYAQSKDAKLLGETPPRTPYVRPVGGEAEQLARQKGFLTPQAEQGIASLVPPVTPPPPPGAPSEAPIVATMRINIDGEETTKVTRQDGSVELDGVQVIAPKPPAPPAQPPAAQQLMPQSESMDRDLMMSELLGQPPASSQMPPVSQAKTPNIDEVITAYRDDPEVLAGLLADDLNGQTHLTGEIRQIAETYLTAGADVGRVKLKEDMQNPDSGFSLLGLTQPEMDNYFAELDQYLTEKSNLFKANPAAPPEAGLPSALPPAEPPPSEVETTSKPVEEMPRSVGQISFDAHPKGAKPAEEKKEQVATGRPSTVEIRNGIMNGWQGAADKLPENVRSWLTDNGLIEGKKSTPLGDRLIETLKQANDQNENDQMLGVMEAQRAGVEVPARKPLTTAQADEVVDKFLASNKPAPKPAPKPAAVAPAAPVETAPVETAAPEMTKAQIEQRLKTLMMESIRSKTEDPARDAEMDRLTKQLKGLETEKKQPTPKLKPTPKAEAPVDTAELDKKISTARKKMEAEQEGSPAYIQHQREMKALQQQKGKATAKQDLNDALGDLAMLMTKKGRLNIVPEDEQQLLPILTRVMDAAFRLGYYKFKDAAKFTLDTIREKLGDDVADQITLDHLQGSYIGMAGKYQDQGASSKKEVVSVESIEELQAEEVAEAEEVPAGEMDINNPSDKYEVAQRISEFFMDEGSFENINQARKMIAELTGQKIKPGSKEAKAADEAVEVGVVLAARDIVASGRQSKLTSDQIYDQLVDLYERQPNLSMRSSTSVAEQAYSTPAPLAFVASELAGITNKTPVYEPTAGNGMLLIGANEANINANELNKDRFDMLERIYEGAELTNKNAINNQPGLNEVIIANPPFGAIGEELIVNGFKTREIDHAISYASLDRMTQDGRAVLILGGVQAKGEDARREGYRSAQKRNFYANLYQNYNVVDHFTVAGSMYSKQGASYPVDVIVIDGKGAAQRALPAADLPQIITSYEQLKEKLNESRLVSRGDRGTSGADRGVGAAGEAKPEGVDRGAEQPSGGVSGEGAGPAAGGKRGVSEAGPTTGGQREPSGRGAGEVQPESANKPKLPTEGKPVSGQGEQVEGRGKASAEGRKPGELGGVSVVSGERVGSSLASRADQEQETAGQVSYSPFSQANAVGTLVPRAMAQSIQESIARVESEVGNVDEYVANALEMDPETLRELFSAEQIDALTLSIRNAEAGKGFIIGDQTGVGKGRVVAAMIRFALINGKVPIFVTEKPNLYSDMIRDLDDIGMTNELSLDTGRPKILMTNGGERVPYTLLRKSGNGFVENNMTLTAPASGAKLDGLLKQMAVSGDIGNYKVIFTTYNQLQTVKGQATERQRFVKAIGADNYLIFDESHNAGGAGEGQARTKEQREKEKAGESIVTGRASFVRNLVQNAYGTFFSSATYAKRPDVMDLYSSTDMKLAVDKMADLAGAIKEGGIPMQQIVANMLTQAGQYIRRERTFAGVSYDTQETKVDKQTAENMATSMRDILEFSRNKEISVKDIKKQLDKQGGIAKEMGEKTTVQSANFGSIMHNLIDQMLLSLKAQDSVRFAMERLKAGEKVVLTVSNTMGSFLQDYADEKDLSVNDSVDLTFADLYLRYLEKQRVITIKKPGGATEKYRLTDNDLGPALVEQYNKIKTFIENAGFGDAPISPIDYLHSVLRKAGYKTEEITGRTVTLNYDNYFDSKNPVLATRTADIRQRVNAVKDFNSGKLDVLILNQAGSTGLSLHASEKVSDKRKRHMIIVQAEKNIDTHMQMLGRVHRTGQVVTPAYSQMMADIPAEMRPAAVLLKKMASLSANTTASRKSAVAAEGAVDFMNDYGGQVAQEYLRDNPEIYEAIGGKYIVDLVEDSTEADENDIRRLTGYIPILPIAQQEEVYKDIIERYNDLIVREDSMGTNKLEAKASDLDAITLSSKAITEDKGDPSVFAQPAYMEQVDVKRTVKPYSKAEVQQMVKDNLDGKSASESSSAAWHDLSDRSKAFGAAEVARMEGSVEPDPIKIEKFKSQLNAQYTHAKSVLTNYPIGTPLLIKNSKGLLVKGVVVNIENKRKTKNPAAGSDWKISIALADGDAKVISMSFSQIGTTYDFKLEPETPYFNPETQRFDYIPMLDLFDKGATVRREKRWMVTGNILAGFAAVDNRGQIMTYTKQDGTTGQGVLMPRTFDFEKQQKDAPVKLRSVNDVLNFFEQFGYASKVTTANGILSITNKGNSYRFTAPSSKREGGSFYLDTDLTDIVGDFYKSGQTMNAQISAPERLKNAIQYLLAERGETLIAGSNKDEARKLFGLDTPTTKPPVIDAPIAQIDFTGEAVEAQNEIIEAQIDKNLRQEQIVSLEKFYEADRGSDKFLNSLRNDIVTFITKGAEAVHGKIRQIIRALSSGLLSVAVVFNPMNTSQIQNYVFTPKNVMTVERQVYAAVPASVADKMSPAAKSAYETILPAVKDDLKARDKLLIITDKPTGRIFVFDPTGKPILDKKVLLGAVQPKASDPGNSDYYKGNNDNPANRITPAGLFQIKLIDSAKGADEKRTAGEYDFGKVFVYEDEGYWVTTMHSVWMNEKDAKKRAAALKSDDPLDSRYSFGCINVDKETYKYLLDNHEKQIDGAMMFVVPDNQKAVMDFVTNKLNIKDDLTRMGVTPVTETVTVPVRGAGEIAGIERKVVGKGDEGIPLANISPADFETQNARWTDKRINGLISEYGYDDGRTVAYVAFIDPADFLKATTGDADAAQEILNEAGKLNLKKLAAEGQTPFLYVEQHNRGTAKENWEIIGHEGRHRMAALSAAGVRQVPVVLKMHEGKYKKPDFYEPISASMGLAGQTFKNIGKGLDLNVSNLIPISEEYKDRIKEVFGKSSVENKILFNQLPPGRSPQLTMGAQLVQSGAMTAAEYDELVNFYKPIKPYAEAIEPATNDQVYDALDKVKRERMDPEIENGTPVGLRLDIPAFNRKGVYVVSIHQKGTKSGPGRVLGYSSVAKARDVTFGLGNERDALKIAAGAAKDALQTVEGKYVNISPEAAYRQAQEAISDPAWVQVGVDPTRHSYFYDKNNTQPVVAAEEVIQIGNMVLAKNVTYGSKDDFLFDQGLNTDENFITDRQELIRRYAKIRQRRAYILTKFAKGEAGLNEQAAINDLDEIAQSLKMDIDLSKKERISAGNFFADATAQWDAGNISGDVYAAIEALYKKYPFVLEQLRFSVRRQPEESNASGQFMALPRMVRLYKGTVGVKDPVTARHEIAHSLEQMMTAEAAADVIMDWSDKLGKAIKTNKNPEAQAYFRKVMEFLSRPTAESYNEAISAMPSYDYYQYINPSEYWAVNAEKLMQRKLGSGWDRFVLAVRKLLEGLKSIFGFDNNYAVHRTFDAIMSAKQERNTKRVLNDYVLTSKMALLNQNIRRNYKGGTAPLATWDSAEESKIDWWVRKVQDRHVDTKRVVQAITEEIGDIGDRWDPYLNEELFHGRTSTQTQDFLKDELQPLLKDMVARGVQLDEFEQYLHNRHAEARNNFIATRNPNMPDGGSGIFNQEAQDYLSNLSKTDKDNFEALAAEIDKIVDRTQELLVSSGLETQETIDAWRKNLPFYVPLQRDQDELDFVNPSSGMGKGYSTRGGFSRSATGSLKSVKDIFGNVALQRERAIVRAEKARVGRALYGLAIMAPNPDFWMPINPEAIKNKKKLLAELQGLGLSPADADNILLEPRTARIDKVTGLVTYKVNPALRNSPNVFHVRVDGKDRFIIFNPGDPRAKRMVEALKNLDANHVSEGLGTIAEATRLLAAMNTQYNPVFGAWNFARDISAGTINLASTPIADRKSEVLFNSTSALRAIYRDLRGKGATTPQMQQWIDLFERFQKAGGQTGYREQFSRSKEKATIIQRELAKLDRGNVRKAADAVFNWLSDYNDAMENAVRVSAFKAALDSGMSEDRAASLAKNLTVNFNRRGQISANANALYAFFNASVQGTARMIELLKSPAGKKIIAGGILIGVIQAVALAMAGFDSDEPPEFIKSKGLIIPVGDGNYLVIPMPLGLNVFPNIGRLITEYALSNSGGMTGKRTLGKTITSITAAVFDAFNPLGSSGLAQTMAPTLLDPIVALYENKDNFGRPISKEDRATSPTPGYQRSRETATTFSKGLAYAINYLTFGGEYKKGVFSPTADDIDYLIGQYTGGVGRESMKLIEAASAKAKGEELPSYRVPLVGKAYGETTTPAAIADKFYKNVTMMAEHENAIKMMQKNRVSTSEYLKDNPEARFYSQANQLENQVSKLNQTKKKLQEMESTPAREAQIKRIDEQKTRMMLNFNNRIKASESK